MIRTLVTGDRSTAMLLDVYVIQTLQQGNGYTPKQKSVTYLP